MQYLKFNLIDKHGVSDQRGHVLIAVSEIESVRTYMHTDHLLSHHEVGSIITMKTGDKHQVSQHTDEITELLRIAAEREEGWVNVR